jgi:hypothetical protein
VSLLSSVSIALTHGVVSRHSEATQTTDSQLKFTLRFKSLEVCSNYASRTTKVIKAAMLGRTDKHEKK